MKPIFALLLFSITAHGQIPKPKSESRLGHIFTLHRDANNLEQRYKDLACALVVIRSGHRTGTGFFISADGDVATAAHVLGDRIWDTAHPQALGQVRIDLTTPPVMSITDHKNVKTDVTHFQIEKNGDAWSTDVAVLKTRVKSPCWFRLGNDRLARPGQHVIAMGFPGLAFGSLSLYSGIISGRVKRDIPVGRTRQGQLVSNTNDLLRVQMPISTGLSGGPIIDDDNRVIAIVTSAGVWSPELDAVMQLQNMGAFQPTAEQSETERKLNVALSSVATLARVFHDYGSPGYGDSVPVSFLRQSKPSSQKPAKPSR
jgi:S1-C subfamily serine protease